jgi:hypothetical protein
MSRASAKDLIPLAAVVVVGIAAALLLPPLVASLRPMLKNATQRALTTVLTESARKLLAF